ncbi:MAG TPA: YchJ family protein [bacterium]|mgnify:CR=1 FL=1|nr:YchJ family protein [bacterium]HPS30501.1 YchJ family protein [bacterium]
MKACHCGSGKNYSDCCELFVKGKSNPKTAEELMRARYSAFVEHEIDFIMNTVSPDQPNAMTREAVKRWAENTNWKGLEIISIEKGGADDSTGIVEFKAYSTVENITQAHHEKAHFIKKGKKWLFEDGEAVSPEQMKREVPKTGRNDLCPCGSGKKYKKCCG